MSVNPWADDPLFGPVLHDLDDVHAQLDAFNEELTAKLADLARMANASTGQVVTVQPATARQDFTTYFPQE